MHGKQKQSQRFSRNHSYFLHLNLLFVFSLEKVLQKIFMSVSKLIMCFHVFYQKEFPQKEYKQHLSSLSAHQ